MTSPDARRTTLRVTAARATAARATAALALGLALSLVAALSWPAQHTAAFSLTGKSLGIDERDVRVFDSFADATANDNTVPHPNFPGSVGAALAIRKAHAEWGSLPVGGNGLGDGLTSNPVLGSGGANFDNTWQGLADSLPGIDGNVHTAMIGGACAGGVVAYVESGVSGGWRIVYCDQFTWDDGPGPAVAGALDLQGIATREIGFTLGLGHSTAGGNPTMAPALSGAPENLRSIEADDQAGIQAIYGVLSLTKPQVTGLGGAALTGGALTVQGTGFASSGNEVWFTAAAATGDPVKVSGLVSTAGGTALVVVVPAGAQSGDVLVKVPGAGGSSLSNAFPIVVDGPPGAFQLTGPGLGSTATGLVPQLTGEGDLGAGGAGFELFVRLAAPSTAGVLFVGLGEGDIPFKGGVFDPVPVIVEVPMTTDGVGAFTLPAVIPFGTPAGTELVLQLWLADGGGPQGVTASNGLRLVTG